MRTRMAAMDGKDRTRVPVTSCRLVRKLWAEFDREAVGGAWDLCPGARADAEPKGSLMC